MSPRPIGWISTLDKDGIVNLAPYSFFNAVSYFPCYVMFSSSGLKNDPMKHSWRNAEETGEFVCNIVPAELADAMNFTAKHVPKDVDELDMAGLTAEPSEKVKPPRVKEAPAHLECKYWKTIELPTKNPNNTGLFLVTLLVFILMMRLLWMDKLTLHTTTQSRD